MVYGEHDHLVTCPLATKRCGVVNTLPVINNVGVRINLISMLEAELERSPTTVSSVSSHDIDRREGVLLLNILGMFKKNWLLKTSICTPLEINQDQALNKTRTTLKSLGNATPFLNTGAGGNHIARLVP